MSWSARSGARPSARVRGARAAGRDSGTGRDLGHRAGADLPGLAAGNRGPLRLSLGIGRAAPARGSAPGRARRQPKHGGRIRSRGDRAHEDLRVTVRAGHPECAAVPRDRGSRASSSRPRAGTRASSSPTCRTSCARRSTRSSASPKCCPSRCSATINDKQAEYLQDILESGRHLLSLINDILDLSKIEAGRMELGAVRLRSAGNAIENALDPRPRAGDTGTESRLRTRSTSAWGRSAPTSAKVKQVLLNLLSNALKFTPEGGRIDVRARAQNGAAEISVTRHRHRHRAGGSGDGVRGVPPGWNGVKESRGHRARPRHFTQVHRAAWRNDRRNEQARRRFDLCIHVAAAAPVASQRLTHRRKSFAQRSLQHLAGVVLRQLGDRRRTPSDV